MTSGALDIAQTLIRCPSVTPEEAGALDALQELLEGKGFTCNRLVFSDEGTPDVDNLFARVGTDAPHLCFAGHTDVVPPGNVSDWTHPPFDAAVDDGWLHGRGAADMKGDIACFAAAAFGFLEKRGETGAGSISFLITGDEEGPAINGTRKVLEWMAQNGHTPDHCLVGEPSCSEQLGDTLRIGRRGSLNGEITVSGVQGHTAYPHLANNPLPGLLGILDAYLAEPLDDGTAHFVPSNLQITAVETGNEARNIIPAEARARFNVRFNPTHTAESLMETLRRKAEKAIEASGLALQIDFLPPSHSFVTEPGPLVEIMVDAIRDQTGVDPELSTGGGTSDARFVKDYCPVIEFGLVNKTIHAVDERVEISDLDRLTAIYGTFIERYFKAFAAA